MYCIPTIVFAALNEEFEGVTHYWPKLHFLLESCPQYPSNTTERLADISRTSAEPREERPNLE